jgi:mannosyltransferase OCH1-like enzyme
MIPKVLHHIWIGPKKPPLKWMNSWREKHPDWEYHLWGNESINSFGFKNIELINEMINNGKYDGASDLMRYEILYKYGGFMPGADCQCLLPIDDLLNCDAFTVYENEKYDSYLVSPILGSISHHPFLLFIVDYFYNNSKEIIDKIPTYFMYELTGNELIGKLIKENNPNVLIYQSNTLIGNHYRYKLGTHYEYDFGYYSSNPLYNKRYAIQHWGTGRRLYE